MKIKISIIMPNYNGAKYLEKSIKSFLNQDYSNKELIIVDGKSVDNSHKIINKFSKKFKVIKWVQKKDKGISDAINIGIKHSSGKIIGYLGSDDFLYKDIFETIAFNYQYVNFDAIYFDSISWLVKKNLVLLRKCPDLILNKNNLIKFGTIVGLQNIYFDKSVFDKNVFDPSLKFAMDLDFLFKVTKNKSNLFYYVNQISTINVQDENISHLEWINQSKESLMITKRNISSILNLFYYLKRYLNLSYEIIKSKL